MWHGRSLTLAVSWGLFWLVAGSAAAEEHHRPVLSRVAAVVLPSHRAHAQTAQVASPGVYAEPSFDAGGYPPYGLGVGPPAFNWGYFGARYRPTSVCHTGYYNQFVQWGYRRGY